jgi:hypothetical protein
MNEKLHSHRVSINDKRRTNKKRSDLSRKDLRSKDIQQVFNMYYRDQVRALYRAVTDN